MGQHHTVCFAPFLVFSVIFCSRWRWSPSFLWLYVYVAPVWNKKTEHTNKSFPRGTLKKNHTSLYKKFIKDFFSKISEAHPIFWGCTHCLMEKKKTNSKIFSWKHKIMKKLLWIPNANVNIGVLIIFWQSSHIW